MARKKKTEDKKENQTDNINNNEENLQLSVVKKAKTETNATEGSSPQNAIVKSNTNKLEIQLVNQRTSNLKAPNMLYTGHKAEVLCVKFHKEGKMFATAGFDREIFLWNTFGDGENVGLLKGHSNTILQLNFSYDGSKIFSASADHSGACFDLETETRLKKFKGHTNHVNSCFPERRGASLIATASDDTTIRLWSLGTKHAVANFSTQLPVTSVCFSKEMDQLISAGIDHVIKVWDLRKMQAGKPLFALEGHHDIVTGIELSPDGTKLLSNSMDNTCKIFDVRAFVAKNDKRCLKSFDGHKHDFQKNLLRCTWSPDGSKVSCGSSDRMVYIWDATTTKNLYKLPGHKGSINEVAFHPFEPIIASASSDKTVYLGEYKA